MITGAVSNDGVPVIEVELAGRTWRAIIDTGFNGDRELPMELRQLLSCRFIGRVTSFLAGGQIIREDAYRVEFPFDGQQIPAEATFAAGNEILLGTNLLHAYRLAVDFPARRVTLQRA